MKKELIVNNHPKSSVAESLRTIKTNLRFSSVNKKVKKILITSCMKGEGKSFVSANLASIFANSTEKVLLIDCDLRKGRQKDLFEVDDKNTGLSNLLIDDNWKKNLTKYIYKTDITNLDILTTGVIPPNPTILMESKKIEEIIAKLEENYDVIILDTPPVIGLSDTLILARLADIILIVAKAKKTPTDLLETTIESLKNMNANIAGIILNRVKEPKNKYYKSYYSEE